MVDAPRNKAGRDPRPPRRAPLRSSAEQLVDPGRWCALPHLLASPADRDLVSVPNGWAVSGSTSALPPALSPGLVGAGNPPSSPLACCGHPSDPRVRSGCARTPDSIRHRRRPHDPLPRHPRGDDPPEPVQDAAPAAGKLVPVLGGWEAALEDRHPGPPVLLLKGDLHEGVDARAVRHRHRRGEDQAPRPVDHLEHVGLACWRGAWRPERDRPSPADAKVAGGLHGPVRRVGVQLLLRVRVGEGVEDDLRCGVVGPLQSQVVTQRRAPFCFRSR